MSVQTPTGQIILTRWWYVGRMYAFPIFVHVMRLSCYQNELKSKKCRIHFLRVILWYILYTQNGNATHSHSYEICWKQTLFSKQKIPTEQTCCDMLVTCHCHFQLVFYYCWLLFVYHVIFLPMESVRISVTVFQYKSTIVCCLELLYWENLCIESYSIFLHNIVRWILPPDLISMDHITF